jgi:hypothetical protein
MIKSSPPPGLLSGEFTSKFHRDFFIFVPEKLKSHGKEFFYFFLLVETFCP